MVDRLSHQARLVAIATKERRFVDASCLGNRLRRSARLPVMHEDLGRCLKYTLFVDHPYSICK